MRTKNFLLYWLPPVLGSAVILIMSGDWGAADHTLGLVRWLLAWLPLSPPQIDLAHAFLRKIGHATVYGTLYFLWFRAYQGHLNYSLTRAFLWSLGLCFLVAVLDEGHQAFIPSRSGRVADLVLDVGGSALGALITFSLWTPRLPSPRPGG